MNAIVLASASPRRRALLQLLGLPFEVRPADGEEDPGSDPPEVSVERVALAKARRVASGLAGPDPAGGRLVVGADTVVVLDGEVLGKPRDERDARRMLAGLSGRTHRVITGVAVVQAGTGRSEVAHEETLVRFREIGPGEIDAYIATGEPLDKAGAYGIQGRGAAFVPWIQGCYFNVVGLPIARLAAMLGEFGVKVLGGR